MKSSNIFTVGHALVLVGLFFGIPWLLSFLSPPTNVIAGNVCRTCLGLSIFCYIAAAWTQSEETREEKSQAKAKVEAQKRAAREAEQKELFESLCSYISVSKSLVNEIPATIAEAENNLTQAEHEFEEGAFAPFWDAVEGAAISLARTDQMIGQIVTVSKKYLNEVPRLASQPPAFTLSLDTLPYPTQTAHRMHVIVRKAQKNFHFASIYEQRKTNKILIAGFSNLAEALNQMSYRLETSIESLADSLSEISQENRVQAERLIEALDKVNETLDSESAARRDHEDKQRDMLDNIQRGRKPRRVYPETFE